jgi:RNA polymerase subunit RPABC4/transcription elongation factor Spt4/ribosomal protein L40E
VKVTFNVTYDSTYYEIFKVVTSTIRQNGMVVVEFPYTLPVVDENTEFEIEMHANPDRTINEWVWTNNNVSGMLTVLDVRPDFEVTVENIYIQYGVDNLTAPVYGMNITIVAFVYNRGGTDPGAIIVQFGMLMFEDTPISNVSVSVPGGVKNWEKVEANYLINITDAGNYTMYVFADSEGAVSEKSETNNYVEFGFEIEQLVVAFNVVPRASEYEVEDDMIVDVLVWYDGTTTPVKDLRGVSIELRDADGVSRASTLAVSTNTAGTASLTLAVPPDLESGTYSIVCTVAGLEETGLATVEIHGVVSGGDIPFMVWIIVIAAIAAGAIGVTAYVYWYGLGKLVECGECGEFIPASNKRCPKCGVEFEVGTMKCSECGAWVPAESAECPNCGVKFVGEEIEEGDYLEKMRKEYDEMTSKYRELAKAELGKKFSDKKFEEWWIAQPTYISFEDWLAKEEEKRKEGPVACPVCGTLNPKEATVCNRCGTVFGAAKETDEGQGPPPYPPMGGQEQAAQAPPAQQPVEPAQPQPAPKMVIRRPIDRKVVPKKIIKTPINQNGSEGDEGNEGQ